MRTLSNSKTYCLNNNILYNYNRKRGMSEFNISDLFCVIFDDYSIMDEFYLLVQNYNVSTFNSYVSTVSDPKLDSIINNNSTLFYVNPVVYVNKNAFNFDDPLVLYNKNKNTNYDGYFFIKSVGPYGECVNNAVVRFWKNIPKFTCLQIIVELT